MNSFLSYMGGKSLLTKKIIPLIPQHQILGFNQILQVILIVIQIIYQKQLKQEVLNKFLILIKKLNMIIVHLNHIHFILKNGIYYHTQGKK